MANKGEGQQGAKTIWPWPQRQRVANVTTMLTRWVFHRLIRQHFVDFRDIYAERYAATYGD